MLGRVVDPGEPLWLPEDQDKAIAWMAYLAELAAEAADGRCPRGHKMDEWVHPENGRPLRNKPYVGETVECLACKEVADQQDDAKREGRDKLWHHTVLVPFNPDRDYG